jgi:hypothetical protein
VPDTTPQPRCGADGWTYWEATARRREGSVEKCFLVADERRFVNMGCEVKRCTVYSLAVYSRTALRTTPLKTSKICMGTKEIGKHYQRVIQRGRRERQHNEEDKRSKQSKRLPSIPFVRSSFYSHAESTINYVPYRVRAPQASHHSSKNPP